ncbi:MAG: D-alanine--D-alanine ligase family protein [Patescibacteria group bacterium]|nr:D-alanine--D-alanine ligase family protein [Patescibacteria group bacterium]
MKKKLKIALIFGGKSVEHEVSLMSAKNVAEAMDKSKYSILYIGIDKKGRWFRCDSSLKIKGKEISPFDIKADVAFPILHGPYGEDGTIQGLLKLNNIPFVGSSILGSSVGFDKDVTKRLLTKAGIANTKFLTFKRGDKISFDEVIKNLGNVVIVKPANSGSSVGVNKAENEKEFNFAIRDAFKFDTKIIIEQFIQNKKEIECAVLGNEDPKASVCGEVITQKDHKFYSYQAKYLDEDGALLVVPAKIPKLLQKKIQKLSIEVFKILELEGMSRIDFLIKGKKILVNEINTIPGFTNISMYPMLWKESGISYSKLIDKLINLAIKRYKRDQKLRTSYD